MSLRVYWFKAQRSMHMCKLPSFLCAKRIGAPYGLVLRWIQPHSRYVSSYLCTSAYSAGDKRYCLGLGGWASGSSKVMLHVTRSKGGKTGSANMSKNLSNKAKIYGSLAPGARGVRVPSYSSSSMSLAPIARRLPDGHNNVNQVALWDLQTVFNKDAKSTAQPKSHTMRKYPASPNHQTLQT